MLRRKGKSNFTTLFRHVFSRIEYIRDRVLSWGKEGSNANVKQAFLWAWNHIISLEKDM